MQQPAVCVVFICFGQEDILHSLDWLHEHKVRTPNRHDSSASESLLTV